jgi:hypothetical protein
MAAHLTRTTVAPQLCMALDSSQTKGKRTPEARALPSRRCAASLALISVSIVSTPRVRELRLPEYKHTHLLFITTTISCSSCALLVKSCGGGLE